MVYMILGTGFEPMEAIAPCDILRRGGVEVQLAGIGGTLIEAGHGVRVQADCRVEDLKLASTDMVILPGGLGGVHSILACDTAMNFIRLAYEDGKYIAAICAAPTILAQLHMDGSCKAVRTHDALIVGNCIAEYQTNSVNAPRCTVAGNRAQGCGKE